MKKRKEKNISKDDGKSDSLNSDKVQNDDFLEKKEGGEDFLKDNSPYFDADDGKIDLLNSDKVQNDDFLEKKEAFESIVEKKITVSPDKTKDLKITLGQFLQLKKYNTKMSILLEYKRFCSVQNIKEFSRKEFEEHFKNHVG